MEEPVEVKWRNITSPWRNIAEFNDVVEWIYGETSNTHSWQRAIEELLVWINRRRAQCPAAVYATHAMLEVKLADQLNNLKSENELKSLYAFALVRFFNFMSSTIQTHNMRSMYTTAIELGLESFVVDIRHICAHGTELPELSILRNTVDYCINWLHDYYWVMQAEKMIDANANCLKKRDQTIQKCSTEFAQLFGLYDSALECHLNRCETLKEIKKKLRGQDLAAFKDFSKRKNLKTIRKAFDIIVMDMVAIFKSGVSRKHLSTVFSREFMKMKFFFAVAETHSSGVELEELLDVVQNLFRFLAVYNVIEPILQRLLETAESPSTVSETVRKGASFWAKHIVDGFAIFIRSRKMCSTYDEDAKGKYDYAALNFGVLSKSIRQAYVYSGINIKRSIIFGDSFKRPWVWHFNRSYLEKRIKAVNSYTVSILPSLWPLVKPKLGVNEITELQKLIEVYLDGNSEKTDGNFTEKQKDKDIAEEKIYTLRDVFSNNEEKSKRSNNIGIGADEIYSLENLNGWRNMMIMIGPSVRLDVYHGTKIEALDKLRKVCVVDLIRMK